MRAKNKILLLIDGIVNLFLGLLLISFKPCIHIRSILNHLNSINPLNP